MKHRDEAKRRCPTTPHSPHSPIPNFSGLSALIFTSTRCSLQCLSHTARLTCPTHCLSWSPCRLSCQFTLIFCQNQFCSVAHFFIIHISPPSLLTHTYILKHDTQTARPKTPSKQKTMPATNNILALAAPTPAAIPKDTFKVDYHTHSWHNAVEAQRASSEGHADSNSKEGGRCPTPSLDACRCGQLSLPRSSKVRMRQSCSVVLSSDDLALLACVARSGFACACVLHLCGIDRVVKALPIAQHVGWTLLVFLLSPPARDTPQKAQPPGQRRVGMETGTKECGDREHRHGLLALLGRSGREGMER
jgi:hypothetical protein